VVSSDRRADEDAIRSCWQLAASQRTTHRWFVEKLMGKFDSRTRHRPLPTNKLLHQALSSRLARRAMRQSPVATCSPQLKDLPMASGSHSGL
jgi:hypothetical protein